VVIIPVKTNLRSTIKHSINTQGTLKPIESTEPAMQPIACQLACELPPEPWRTPLCGSVGRSGLVVDRGLHATGTVATSSIIEVDDPFHNSLLRFFPGFEMMPGEYLVFQC